MLKYIYWKISTGYFKRGRRFYLDTLLLMFDFSSALKEASSCNFSALCSTRSYNSSFESSCVYLMVAKTSRAQWLFYYVPYTPKNRHFWGKYAIRHCLLSSIVKNLILMSLEALFMCQTLSGN